MSVNRYKILASSLQTAPSGSTMVLPFSLNFFPVDNSELVQTNFVEVETKKAINPIVDYEKSRFEPYNGSYIQIDEIKIKLWNAPGSPTYYSDLGITDSDIKFNRNRFLNTFLRLSFYDSDQITNSKFLFDNTYFTQIGPDQRVNGTGDTQTASNMPVSYLISDPIIYPNKFAEGFYLYWLTKDVINGPKNIYMRATMNNAVDGKTTQYYAVVNTPPPIYNDVLFQKLNVKYTITNDTNNIFRYNVDDTSRTINISNTTMTINLFKLIVQ